MLVLQFFFTIQLLTFSIPYFFELKSFGIGLKIFIAFHRILGYINLRTNGRFFIFGLGKIRYSENCFH
jgi:hypothetical protein